jgi:hypothetical protein
MKKPIIINLFGGPGSGKSTTASGLFYELKTMGLNCELVTEFAKHMTWKEDFNTLKNQIYVFAKQHDRMFHLMDKVDVIITDSPIIMGLSYCDWNAFPRSFEQLVVDVFNDPNSVQMNFFIERKGEYQQSGRSQTEEQAKEKDREILGLLDRYGIIYDLVKGDKSAISTILSALEAKL